MDESIQQISSPVMKEIPAAAPFVLTHEQRKILLHTHYLSVYRVYCGDSPDMQGLVKAGLMEFAFRRGWCPDPFFRITDAGIEAIKGVGR